MDHAKKMLLVDPAKLTALTANSSTGSSGQLNESYRSTIVDKQLSKLDRDIAETLSTNLADDEKAKIYSTILRKYRYFEQKPAKSDDIDVIKSVPFSLRSKAARLLKHIKPYARWSDTHEIVGKNELVQNSDIGELLTAALRDEDIAAPRGLGEFADVLKRARTPKELIGNRNLWKYMNPRSKKTIKMRGWENL
jgi:hypothetical protein